MNVCKVLLFERVDAASIHTLWCLGVVLAVISHGGLLLTTNQITPGSLMSFLAASQTIQRYAG